MTAEASEQIAWRVVALSLVLSLIFAGISYAMCGASLGLFIGGFFLTTILLPPLSMTRNSFLERALIVAAAYLMLAGAAWLSGSSSAPWAWLFAFFVILTFGELFILPTGLGLFARLAPPGMGATTVAAWFLAIFSGSLAAGFVGTLWGDMSHAAFFALLAALAAIAAILLRMLDPFVRRVDQDRAEQSESF